MQFEVIIIITSIIIYSIKYHKLESYRKMYENNRTYDLNRIVIYK